MGMVLRSLKQPVTPVYLSANFDVAQNPLAAPWVNFGTGIYLPEAFGGAMRIVGSGTDGTNYGYALHSTPMATDRHLVRAKITTTNSTWPSWLILNSDASGNNTVFFNWTGSTISIQKKINGTDTSLTSASESQIVNKRAEIVCDSSGGIYTYTAYINDVQKLSFVDSSNTLGHGPDRRFVGLGGTRRRAVFTNSWSPNWDDWSAEDL
ncbi:hypothetical protein KHQ84_gp034 [Rhodococcus phage Finch]|uniref:DUF7257 domain-containing protein n=1 Tax=Rhodococcus phage Finch TaxID=2094144 RepID=A0A2P1JXB6_9CAUD|nr:hypothetical protein KHQ84_gp034 [Rhodococcus phage Finch]AVO24975.1 hypothetical protein SEA_FINCH_34 [Rhodococcus phage Finch]